MNRMEECLMKTSQILVACLALLAGYVAATALNRPSSAQAPAAVAQPVGQNTAVWRYQATVPDKGYYENYIIVTDTATGHCWAHDGNDRLDHWQDLGSP